MGNARVGPDRGGGEVRGAPEAGTQVGRSLQGRPTTGRRSVLAAYERRLQHEVTHPLFGYKASYRRILEVQARLLARHVLGELDEYPSFTTR